VIDRPNPKRSRQAAKRLQRRRRRFERRVLDDAYQAYLRDLVLAHDSHNDSYNDSQNDSYNGALINLLAATNRAIPSIR